MKTINHEYYGDDVRWFIGTAIDNTPPYGLEGRVQVRIHGIHSDNVNDIPQRDLPWAQVLNPGNTYGVSGFGTSAQILPGALVFGFFLDGVTSQLPMIIGSMPRIEFPSSVQANFRDDPASNPFSYYFNQTNSQVNDPILTVAAKPEGDVVRYFIDNGFNAKQACSITGVLSDISGLDPNNVSNGIGIAGLPPFSPRLANFYAYVARLQPAKAPEDIEGQLLFVLHELRTSRAAAFSKMLRAKEISGQINGEKIDGIITKGNGMVAALVKYYVHPLTSISQSAAEGKAESLFSGLGAR